MSCYHKQDFHSKMQQHSSKGTCNAATSVATFQAQQGCTFKGTPALCEGKSITRYSISVPVVEELYWKQLFASEYL